MKIKDLVIDEFGTLGETFVLTEVSLKYAYVNGERTERVEGTYYSILCADRGYMTTRVAISGGIKIPPEDVAKNPKITFDGLNIRLYYINKKMVVSITAEDIHVIKP